MYHETPLDTGRADTGFTLIEVLLAVAICAIAITGIFTMVQAVLHMAESVQTSMLSTESDNACLDRLETDLHSIYWVAKSTNESFSFIGYDSEDQSSIEKARNETDANDIPVLEFACLASFTLQMHQHGHRISRVRYVLREQNNDVTGFDSEKTYRLIRLESPYADLDWRSDEKRPWIEREILSNIQEIQLTFLETVNGQDVEEDTWNSVERIKNNKSPTPQRLHIEMVLFEQDHNRTLIREIGFPSSEWTLTER